MIITIIVVMSLSRSSKLYNEALQDLSVMQRRFLLTLVFSTPILTLYFASRSALKLKSFLQE